LNQLNYASLEASKKLQEAGIVLETDCCFVITGRQYNLPPETIFIGKPAYPCVYIPAPTMAEVWKELPETTWMDNYHYLYASPRALQFHDQPTPAWRKEYRYAVGYMTEKGCVLCEFGNDNPIDALVDLLIWVRKVKP